MRFSANLGFLWAELALPEAIRAARRAGFDAVECHWPYDVPVAEVRAALDGTGLPMLGLNTRQGGPGENGLAALPGRRAEAFAAVDEALDYAAAVGARAVHVMAGIASGAAAEAAFIETLRHACDRAGSCGILIEPLNAHDAPGYFLRTTDQAAAIVAAVDRPNLRLMFDCYHVQRTEGDALARLVRLAPIIGHVQVASVPDRGAPDHGQLDHTLVWQALAGIGWDAPVGAEYRPGGDTDATLGWLKGARAAP